MESIWNFELSGKRTVNLITKHIDRVFKFLTFFNSTRIRSLTLNLA